MDLRQINEPVSFSTTRFRDNVFVQSHEWTIEGFAGRQTVEFGAKDIANLTSGEFDIRTREDDGQCNTCRWEMRLLNENDALMIQLTLVKIVDRKPFSCKIRIDYTSQLAQGWVIGRPSRIYEPSEVEGRCIKFHLCDEVNSFISRIAKGGVKIRCNIFHHLVEEPVVLENTFQASGPHGRAFFTGPTRAGSVMSSMFASKVLSDVTIVTRSQELLAHKSVLGNGSKVFENMFLSEMKEAQESVVQMTDFPHPAVDCFLHYFYGKELEVQEKCEECAEDLLALAEKFEVETLKSNAEDWLMGEVSRESVCQLLVLADLNRAKKLEKACIDFIVRHRLELGKSELLQELKTNHPTTFEKVVSALFGIGAEGNPVPAHVGGGKLPKPTRAQRRTRRRVTWAPTMDVIMVLGVPSM